MPRLIDPHGGSIMDLVVEDERADVLKNKSVDIPSITLTKRQLCDLELLLCGGFSPLGGFLNRRDYEGVVERMRLTCGTLWPMPITLDISEEERQWVMGNDQVALRDITGVLLAILHIEDLWKPDKQREAENVFGTTSTEHPAVAYLMEQAGSYYLGGNLEGIRMPPHHDFLDLRHTPKQLRNYFQSCGYSRIVAFQTRNPMHRAHKELTDRASKEIDGHLLIQPAVGMTKPGDIDHYTRVRSYKRLLEYYPEGHASLSLLPLAMRMGGPREALWHAIIRKNYGCTHFIIGRDHAGPGMMKEGQPFHGPYDAQDLVKDHAEELGMEVVPFRKMIYVPVSDSYKPMDEVAEHEESLDISGTQLRGMLSKGQEIPDWFSYPGVIEELQKTYPPRGQQGFAVFLTGLSGSGKSTIANALQAQLLEILSCPVTLLDGDVVRTYLSKGLGFSRLDRSTNVQRIGYVASEIVKHRGVVICAPIAPYEEDRAINRRRIEREGGYIEVFVDAPIEVCERRDIKGLYAKARAGMIKGFTGIDDPYEVPGTPEVVCKTDRETVEESTARVIKKLRELDFLI